jgi:adenosine deaminase
VDVDAIRRLPKAEVHLHLEGCLERDEIVRLAGEAGEALPRPAEQLFDISGLAPFLQFLDWCGGLVRNADQLARLAYQLAQRQHRSGCGYTDVIVNPSHWAHYQHDLDGLVDGLNAGFGAAEEDGLTPIGLCLSLLRSQSADAADELVDWMIDRRHPRVVALSVDGDERSAGRTGPRFAPAFRRAGLAGFGITVHAGESSGPEGVRDALDLLGADRIDHGVRAIEDPSLVTELADRRVPLGVCPGTNLRSGLYPDRAGHPLDQLRRAGVPVSVNTDDPASLGTTLEDELVLAQQAYRWDDAVVFDVVGTAIDASFADPDRKRALRGALAARMPPSSGGEGRPSPR